MAALPQKMKKTAREPKRPIWPTNSGSTVTLAESDATESDNDFVAPAKQMKVRLSRCSQSPQGKKIRGISDVARGCKGGCKAWNATFQAF